MNLKALVPRYIKVIYWKILRLKIQRIEQRFFEQYFEPTKQVILVFGCQRSGTTALGILLGLSPFITEYGEGNGAIFNEDEYLRPLAEVKLETNKTHRPFVMIKPIMHNHEIHSIAEALQAQRYIWLFREYQEVVHSIHTGHPIIRKGVALQFEHHLSLLPTHECEKIRLLLQHTKVGSPDHYLAYWIIENLLFLDFYAHKADKTKCSILEYDALANGTDVEVRSLFEWLGIPITKKILGYYKKKDKNRPSYSFDEPLLLYADEVLMRMKTI